MSMVIMVIKLITDLISYQIIFISLRIGQIGQQGFCWPGLDPKLSTFSLSTFSLKSKTKNDYRLNLISNYFHFFENWPNWLARVLTAAPFHGPGPGPGLGLGHSHGQKIDFTSNYFHFMGSEQIGLQGFWPRHLFRGGMAIKVTSMANGSAFQSFARY